MTNKNKTIAGAIAGAAVGSAAIAAALLYSNKRKGKDRKAGDKPHPAVPGGEKPETD